MLRCIYARSVRSEFLAQKAGPAAEAGAGTFDQAALAVSVVAIAASSKAAHCSRAEDNLCRPSTMTTCSSLQNARRKRARSRTNSTRLLEPTSPFGPRVDSFCDETVHVGILVTQGKEQKKPPESGRREAVCVLVPLHRGFDGLENLHSRLRHTTWLGVP
jgi:hypothetical protein